METSRLTLDCSGQFCPVPILMTEEALSDLKGGQILEVIFTDPGAEPDLKVWCKVNGHTFLSVNRQKTKRVALIRKDK